MRSFVKLPFFLFVFVAASFADTNKTAYIYTLCPRELVLSVETSDVSSFMSPGEGVTVTGYYKMDEDVLLWLFDSLRDHLLASVDTSKCSSEDYLMDDVVFNFYRYYLQVIPFYNGPNRMAYINAYIYNHNKDKSPSKGFVWVFDGGYAYWSIVWDLKKNEFSNMRIHSE